MPSKDTLAVGVVPPVTDRPARLAVLVSGSGTNLQAVLDACARGDCGAVVSLVVSDQADAYALVRAAGAGVRTAVQPLSRRPGRPSAAESPADRQAREAWQREFDAWDGALADRLAECSPDLVISAGFMRLLGRRVLETFPLRVLNTHPALLPSFPGTHAVRDALAYGVRVTGATVHLVDSGVDSGPVVDQVAVRVEPDDDEASLHERIKVQERRMLVDVVGRMVRHGYEIDGRRVVLK